ncbi:unnamed protein product [Caenorhabditis angaria]|uniref:Uncharacterized protein n=1 Tax=Caenorhabditis angaria TaxID=860376 RepID=A0A9P1IW61_9PELO|nr:unnamed protein product [Caenorhabditis angaria]
MYWPNETCHEGLIAFDVFLTVYDVSSIYSNLIYLAGLFALIYRCPDYFRRYQMLLGFHTLVNMLFENYVTNIWKILVTPPWLSICSYGPIYQYPEYALGIFLTIIGTTAFSIMLLFEYRMRAVLSSEQKQISQVARCFRYLFYAFQLCVVGTYMNAYDSFKYQNDYKNEMNMISGPFPMFIYCDNCILFNFDSKKCIIFVVTAILSTSIAVNTILLMAWISYSGLTSHHTVFSKRTMLLQRSFLSSLFIQITVHLGLLAFPILFFFAAFLMKLTMEKWQVFTHILALLFAQHGSFSTLAMLISNKQLRRNLFSFVLRLRRKFSKHAGNSEMEKNTSSLALQHYPTITRVI